MNAAIAKAKKKHPDWGKKPQTNMLGEVVEVKKLTFERSYPTLWVFYGGKFYCDVSPNGWTGNSASVNHELGEPLISNLPDGHELSFKQIRQIMREFRAMAKAKK